MVRWLRAILRLKALVAVTAFFHSTWVAARALRWISRRPPGGRGREFRGRVFRGWARSVLWVMGVTVDVEGEPPTPPFLLVANHLGYLDVAVLASRLDGVTFVAKEEVADWPVVGRLCRSMEIVFVDRAARRGLPETVAAMEDRLRRGHGVVLFPEGTSTAGAEVGTFRSPLLAAATGRPVHWAALGYSTPPGEPPAHLAVCWWGGMTFPDHLFRLLTLSGVRAKVTFGSGSIREDERKRLAARLRDAVAARFEPVVETEER